MTRKGPCEETAGRLSALRSPRTTSSLRLGRSPGTTSFLRSGHRNFSNSLALRHETFRSLRVLPTAGMLILPRERGTFPDLSEEIRGRSEWEAGPPARRLWPRARLPGTTGPKTCHARLASGIVLFRSPQMDTKCFRKQWRRAPAGRLLKLTSNRRGSGEASCTSAPYASSLHPMGTEFGHGISA